MGTINRHGLRRDIPEPIARIICGFGCAICGGALVIAYRFDPPFVDARHVRPGELSCCVPIATPSLDMCPQNARENTDSFLDAEDGFTRGESLLGFEEIPKVELGQITATSGRMSSGTRTE